MRDAPAQHPLLTSPNPYALLGYPTAQMVQLVRVTGRKAPNVIELRPRLAKEESRDD